MMARIVSIGTESREWVGLAGCMARERVAIPSVNTTPFQNFLPCPGFSASARTFGCTQSIYMESDLSDLMEEDVWGDKASTYAEEVADSSFDDCKYLATYARQVADRDTMKTSRSLSPTKKYSVSMYGMAGMPSDYPTDIMERSFVSIHAPRSAPVEVPLWSNIYGRSQPADKYADLDDDEERLPPHELLARQNARSPLSMFSVVEGVGRKLKGRDASKVRDAVWKQTGFPG